LLDACTHKLSTLFTVKGTLCRAQAGSLNLLRSVIDRYQILILNFLAARIRLFSEERIRRFRPILARRRETLIAQIDRDFIARYTPRYRFPCDNYDRRFDTRSARADRMLLRRRRCCFQQLQRLRLCIIHLLAREFDFEFHHFTAAGYASRESRAGAAKVEEKRGGSLFIIPLRTPSPGERIIQERITIQSSER